MEKGLSNPFKFWNKKVWLRGFPDLLLKG